MVAIFGVLIAFLQPAPQPVPGAQGPQGPAQPPATTAPAVQYNTGPLKAEVIAMFDARYFYAEATPGARESELRLQIRVSGESIDNIARTGNVIFTEAVDSTGRALIAADTYTEEQKTDTRPLSMPPERIRSQGVLLGARLNSPARAAASMRLRGSLRLIVAEKREELTFEKPLQLVGTTLDNARLKELGIEIRVIAADQLADENIPPQNEFLALQFVSGRDRVHEVALHDAYLKPMRPRERQFKTRDGATVTGYVLSGGKTLDENVQLVVKVFPDMQDIRLPIELDAVTLP